MIFEERGIILNSAPQERTIKTIDLKIRGFL